MDRSIADMAVTLTLEMKGMSDAKVRSDHKRTAPFRKEPVDSHQVVYDAMQLTPEMEQSLRLSMGDDIIDEYLQKANQAQARLTNGRPK